MGGAVVRLVPHVQRASCRVAEGDREGRGRGLPRPRKRPAFYTWQSVATRRSARAFRRVSGCFPLAAGPAEDAMRSVLHWGARGIFGQMLIAHYGLSPGFGSLGREPVEVLKHAVAGPRVGPARYDARL